MTGETGGGILSIDHDVPHLSSVPAIAGERVNLFLRERVAPGTLDADGHVPDGKAVLLVHGGYWPGTVAFDLDYQDYSWLADYAQAGYAAFAIDMTGYGRSPRPMMNDPRNLPPDMRAALGPDAPPDGPAPYPYQLATSDSETADLDRAIDYIRDLRGVDRVHLIGWSGGGCRTGTYARRHPEKVSRLVIWSSSNYRPDGPDDPPAELPAPGYPVLFQPRAIAEGRRWTDNIHCTGQVAPGLQEIAWQASLAADPIGASWGTGGLCSPGRTYWGWTRRGAAQLKLPVLVVAGVYDNLYLSNAGLYRDLGTEKKAFLGIDCASHFMMWEMQRHLLRDAAREWLETATVAGHENGTFHADAKGHIAPAPLPDEGSSA